MVAVRGSHLLNPQDFVIEQWCSSLKLPAATEKSLIDAWYYAQAKIAEHADKMENAVLTLQSGVEMVEILHEMNMDSESLLTAMLFPLVANKIVDWEQIQEHFGPKITKLLKGVEEMDNILSSMPAILPMRLKWIMYAVCSLRWWTISVA